MKIPSIRQVFVKLHDIILTSRALALFYRPKKGYFSEKSNSAKDSAIGASCVEGCPFFRQVNFESLRRRTVLRLSDSKAVVREMNRLQRAEPRAVCFSEISPRSQTPLGRGIGPLSTGLHFCHPLPRSIKNFVNDDRGTPGGGGWRLALQEVHKIDFSSGIFSAIGPALVGGETVCGKAQLWGARPVGLRVHCKRRNTERRTQTSKCGIDVERWTFLLRSLRFAVSEASGRMPDLAGETPPYPGLPIGVVSW